MKKIEFHEDARSSQENQVYLLCPNMCFPSGALVRSPPANAGDVRPEFDI